MLVYVYQLLSLNETLLTNLQLHYVHYKIYTKIDIMK